MKSEIRNTCRSGPFAVCRHSDGLHCLLLSENEPKFYRRQSMFLSPETLQIVYSDIYDGIFLLGFVSKVC
jgi:hypothetical protein